VGGSESKDGGWRCVIGGSKKLSALGRERTEIGTVNKTLLRTLEKKLMKRKRALWVAEKNPFTLLKCAGLFHAWGENGETFSFAIISFWLNLKVWGN